MPFYFFLSLLSRLSCILSVRPRRTAGSRDIRSIFGAVASLVEVVILGVFDILRHLADAARVVDRHDSRLATCSGRSWQLRRCGPAGINEYSTQTGL